MTTSIDTPEAVDELSRLAGVRVRAARIARGWSQVSLAKEAGVARQTLVLLESGQLRPRLDTLGHLAAALGVPPAVLVAPAPADERRRLLLGIVATCRAIGVPVQAYLAWAFERLGTHRDQFGLDLEQITPAALKTAAR